MSLPDSEIIRFDQRAKERFVVCGLATADAAPLRAFFERFGMVSDCKVSVSNGVVFGFVAFHSQRATELVKRNVRFAVIDDVRVRVLCNETKNRSRALPLHQMIDVANAFFGPTGWSSEVLECCAVPGSQRQVDVVGDDDDDDGGGDGNNPFGTSLAASAVPSRSAPSAPVRKMVQETFRARVRLQWDARKVVTSDAARNFVIGCADKLVVQPSRELCLDLGTKAGLSDALKDAFCQLALVVLYNADGSTDLAVHFRDESAAEWDQAEEEKET